jgi:hypothetical protein
MEALDAFNILSDLYNSGSLSDLTFIASPSWGDLRDLEFWIEGRFPVSFLEGAIGVIPSAAEQSVLQDCISEKRINTTVRTD